MILFGPVGNILLGKGMKRIGPVDTASGEQLARVLALVLKSSWIWLGIASLLAFFITYLLALSWADYSYVQPASSLAYAVVALLGKYVLGESVTTTAWIGIAVICLGVFVVGYTPPHTTGPKP